MRRPLLVPSLFALSIALPRSARAELPPLPAEGAPVATSSPATAPAEAPAAPPTPAASAEPEPDAAPAPAAACPPGAWFCAQEAPKGAAAPPPGAPPPGFVYLPAPTPPPPAARPGPQRGYSPYPDDGGYRPVRRSWQPEWWLGARLQGVMMGNHGDRSQDAGMGGVGIDLRLRPIAHFAVDVGVDVIGGTDYHGDERTETVFSVNPMVFVNPRSAVQVYFLGGLALSSARVTHASDGTRDNWSYAGVDGGVGVEFRLSRKLALDVDLVGFVRGRTDSAADRNPEFVDEVTGRTSNTSGGGLMRVGIAFAL